MACIGRSPRCYPAREGENGLTTYGAVSLAFTIAALIGIAVGLVFPYPVSGIIIAVFLAAMIAALWIADLIGGEGRVKCSQMEGTSSCAAGVIINIVRSFSETGDDIFPFLAWHNCVHLLVTSYYWDRLEEGASGVMCTGEAGERNSAYILCYYYDPRVCSAYHGGVAGLAVGAVVGIIAGIAIGVVIGCATVILCLLALLVAIFVAIACAIIGAIIGGHAGKAAGEDEPDTYEEAGTLSVGQLVTVQGNLAQVTPGGQKIFWFVNETASHGNASTSRNNPYSYCEIDEEPALQVGADGCSEMY